MNSNEVQIELQRKPQTTPEQLQEVVQFSEDIAAVHINYKTNMEYYLSQDGLHVATAKSNDGLVGVGLLTARRDFGIFVLDQVAVTPELQGQNIGTEIVRSLERAVKPIAECIEVFSTPKTINFYKKLGYMGVVSDNDRQRFKLFA